MKKIIAILLTLVLTVSLVGCTKNDKKNPQLTNGAQELSSITENGVKYVVTNQEAYNALKAQYGSTILIDLIDTKLMSTLKNKDGKTFFDAVLDEDIVKEIDKVMYGEDELTDKEKDEKKKDFLENLFIGSGIITEDPYATEVKDKYRLVLAERAYAKELLAKDVKENDAKYEEYAKLTKEEQEQKLKDEPKTPTDYYFADSKIQAKYAKDVYSKFEAIIVPFTSKRQAEIALTQINVTVKDGVWTDGTNALSALQVFEKFIKLYKVVYGYKVTGELNKDSEEFKFNEGDLNSNILKVVKDKLETYTEDSKNEAPKWYTPNAIEIGSGNEAIYVLKLKEELATSYEDLDEAGKKAQREKYTDALIDETVTSNYVSVKMGLLRKEQNIVIYDSVVENLYSNAMSKLSVTYDKTKLESAEYVAETTDIKVTPKDLYEAMLKYQGAAIVMDKLVEKRALYNKNFNKYYDMSTNKWLNNNKKTEITDLIEAEKKNFKNGNYKEYGYDPSQMSWTLFIKSLYTVENEDELVLSFLAESITKEYAKNINRFAELNDKGEFVLSNDAALTDNYWRLISNQMEAEAKKKFSVEGIHLLVSHYDTVEDYISGSNIVDPEKWTEEQRVAAEKLVNEVIAFVKDSKGSYASRLERIAEAFKYAPVKNADATYANNKVARTIVSDGGAVTINLSEYKEKGLYVKYESLGVFAQGKMVESFNDAVKKIWDADADKDVFNNKDLNDVDKVTVLETPIKTSFGYHAYINIESKELSSYIKVITDSVDGKTFHKYQYVPTMDEVRKYVKNTNTTEITEKVKNAIKTYYTPIADELSGDAFSYIMMVNALEQVISSYSSTDNGVSQDALKKYIECYKDYTFSDLLSNVTVDYLYVK